MSKNIQLKKGYDIKIMGGAEKKTATGFTSRSFALKPTDFLGIAPIPKMLVEQGEKVLAGQAVFFDKGNPDVMFASPVSGEVAAINRGAKRSIVEIVILADNKNDFQKFDTVNLSSASREQIIALLKKAGCWPFIKQRPFNVLADSREKPKNIFISGFDSAPLAPDYSYVFQSQSKDFQTGVNVLGKLTSGKVHLSLNDQTKNCDAFSNCQFVEKHIINGQHPAGCVGIQIHHIAPINKGDIVWTVSPYDVVTIGRLFNDGIFNTERLVALGGPYVKNPQYYKTYIGANIANMVDDNLSNNHVRYISGNVLTGTRIEANGHLGAFENHLSVIEEGDKSEPFGWLISNYPKPSVSRTYPAFLRPGKLYNVNTNTHGEHRAFVATGVYEKVLPMDMYPLQLFKSILYKDFDLMEGLGIYEVVEEDVALCEFVCPSKQSIQEILRDGLDYMREQA